MVLKLSLVATSTSMRAGRSARAQTMPLSPDTSPDWMPWVISGRSPARPRAGLPMLPAATIAADDAAVARNRRRVRGAPLRELTAIGPPPSNQCGGSCPRRLTQGRQFHDGWMNAARDAGSSSIPGAEAEPDAGAGGGSTRRDIVDPPILEPAECPGRSHPAPDFGRAALQGGDWQTLERSGILGEQRGDDLAVEFFLDHEMAQAARRDDGNAHIHRTFVDAFPQCLAEIVTALRCRRVGREIRVQQHRYDRNRAPAEDSLDDETVRVSEPELVRIVDPGSGSDVELLFDQRRDQLFTELRMGRIAMHMIHRILDRDGVAPIACLLLRPRMREDLLPVVDRYRWHVGRAEQLVMVVSDDDGDVRRDVRQIVAQPIERSLGGGILLNEAFRGRDIRVAVLHGIGDLAIGDEPSIDGVEALILPVVVGALIPALAVEREQRAVGHSDPHDDFCHRFALPADGGQYAASARPALPRPQPAPRAPGC